MRADVCREAEPLAEELLWEELRWELPFACPLEDWALPLEEELLPLEDPVLLSS